MKDDGILTTIFKDYDSVNLSKVHFNKYLKPFTSIFQELQTWNTKLMEFLEGLIIITDNEMEVFRIFTLVILNSLLFFIINGNISKINFLSLESFCW